MSHQVHASSQNIPIIFIPPSISLLPILSSILAIASLPHLLLQLTYTQGNLQKAIKPRQHMYLTHYFVFDMWKETNFFS